MLTFVEAISLAGDRKKQNDDAYGFGTHDAWVIDGATDLHDTPLTGAASDASWIAQRANAILHAMLAQSQAEDGIDLRKTLSEAIGEELAPDFDVVSAGRSFERWRSPIASLLLVPEQTFGVNGVDLGDCRVFALGADGETHVAGGPGDAGDDESKLAAQQTDADKPLLERQNTIAMLRANRAAMNQPGGTHWTFGVDPECANHARTWSLQMTRPAHILLMTDGFSALADRYAAYDAGGLVQAALDKGLQELGRELRVIEAADANGSKHPRFKASDDATALLLRLT